MLTLTLIIVKSLINSTRTSSHYSDKLSVYFPRPGEAVPVFGCGPAAIDSGLNAGFVVQRTCRRINFDQSDRRTKGLLRAKRLPAAESESSSGPAVCLKNCPPGFHPDTFGSVSNCGSKS